MTIREYIEKYISDNFYKELEQNKDAIVKYLLSNQEKISIVEKIYGFDDYDKIIENNGFTKEDKLIEVSDSGIVTSNLTNSFVKLIVDNISKNIKELEIPEEIFKKIKITDYKELEKLRISGNILLTKDYLEKLKTSTKLKEFVVNKFEYDESIIEDEILFEKFGRKLLYYNGFALKEEYFEFSDYMDVKCKKPYKKIEKIFSLLDSDMPITSLSIIDTSIKKDESVKYSIRYSKEKDYTTGEEGYVLIFNNFDSISDIKSAINIFKKHNKKIDEIKINLLNKDYDDIRLITSIEKEYNVSLYYKEAYKSITLKDYISMRETLNYYKNLILEANLSPLEKVTFAYDIIKSFHYQEAEDRSISRNIHSIVRDGKIVCVGYAAFLSQLLKEVGIDSFSISTSVPTKDGIKGHQRNVVKIKDDKYSVDGVFALDATWDSAKDLIKIVDENGKEDIVRSSKKQENQTKEKEYDNLSLYEYFLVPASEYQKVFSGEKMPNFSSATYYKNDDSLESAESVASEFVGDKRPDFTKLLKLISNVRLKQGYTKEQTLQSIEEIIELHEYSKKMDEEEKAVVKK